MPLRIAFVWHMHQPLYLEPDGGELAMPWVRLHGVKAYADMVTVVEEEPEARVTFNLVPSLLLQIEAYMQGKRDHFWRLTERPADELDDREREALLSHFFSCNWATMVEPYARYRELLYLRGKRYSPGAAGEVAARFAVQDWRDLQVWYNLCWMGFSSRGDPLIQELLEKGRNFSEEDKLLLLDYQLQLLSSLVSRYSSLWREGRIEVSTSPFYHPILPLLIDSNIAMRCMPSAQLPSRFSYPEDAREQLVRARRFIEERMGMAPVGLWPSEGSVAPELVDMAVDAGFSWCGSDQMVLERSKGYDGPSGLFRPWLARGEHKEIAVVFRHHGLSDHIGFDYSAMDPGEAVDHFLSTLRSLDLGPEDGHPPLVTVILDGENPWEYYSDGGEAFLRRLYTALVEDEDIEMVTPARHLEEHPPRRGLSELYSGSWINGDFGIWIGGEEENKAWELLLRARRAVSEELMASPGSVSGRQALEHLLVAEGSDWFWWYGDQFETAYGMEFDRLFRSYVEAAYRLLDRDVPDELHHPIKGSAEVVDEQPVSFRKPEIDGHISFYWEWAGAGRVSRHTLGGAMYRGSGGIKGLYFGFDESRFYLRLDPEDSGFAAWPHELSIAVKIVGGRELEIVCSAGEDGRWTAVSTVEPGEGAVFDFAVGEILELGVPYTLLAVQPFDEIRFCVELRRHGIVEVRFPLYGFVSMSIPDEDFEKRLWMV